MGSQETNDVLNPIADDLDLSPPLLIVEEPLNTIRPTTTQSQKSAAITFSSINNPGLDDEESSINFNAVPAYGDDTVLPGCSSNDGSNSNSLETCDPLYISNDRPDSNPAVSQISKDEPKKKKKRSPATIPDYIKILPASDKPLRYQCNVCMKKFKTKANIKYHEFCQNNGEKPYKCEQCGQGFIAKSHYEYHLRTHTGERPYVCPKCGKGFNQQGKVTRHMRSHAGEKPFICQQCGKRFSYAQALRSHFLIHTGERPFACQYCDKRFTGKANLKKHVITHTGERTFSCNHCEKSFGSKWTLVKHLRTHSKERPFACDQCTRAFSTSKDLRRHLFIHSGERPFQCWICGTAFRRKDNLDRHIKKTHQPKEVSKQLANEAAAEYLEQTKYNQVKWLTKSASPTPVSLFSPASAKAASTDPVAGTSRGHSMSKIDKKSGNKNASESADVIITGDIPQPMSPPIGESDAGNVWHGAGNNDSAVQERVGDKEIIEDGNSDLLFCATSANSSSIGQNCNHELTFTQFYENYGITHLADQPMAYHSEMDLKSSDQDPTPNHLNSENHCLSGSTDSTSSCQHEYKSIVSRWNETTVKEESLGEEEISEQSSNLAG